MTTWIAVVAVGAISYLFRAAPLLLLGRVHLSNRADRAIRHAGAAALTALLVDALRHGTQTSHPVAFTVAAAIGLWSALRGGSMLRVIALGSAAYVAVSAIRLVAM